MGFIVNADAVPEIISKRTEQLAHFLMSEETKHEQNGSSIKKPE